MNKKAFNWLDDIAHKTWTRHLFDHEVKVEYATNNLTDFFNSCFRKYRSMSFYLVTGEN